MALFKFNLQKKFIGLTSFVIVLTSMLLNGYYVREHREHVMEEMSEKGHMLTRSLADSSEYDVMFSDTERLDVLIRSIALDKDVRYIVISSGDGEVLSEFHAKPGLPYPEEGNVVGFTRKKQDDEHRAMTTTRFYPAGGDVLAFDINCPILTEKASRQRKYPEMMMWESERATESAEERIVIGRVRLGISSERVVAEFREIQRDINILTAVVILFGLVLTIPLTRVLTNPLRNLMEAIQATAQGDLSRTVKIGSSDEIGELGKSFNRMVVELKTSRDEIEEYSRTLEEKVEDRTAELARANESLESELRERERAEQLLRASEEKYRTIFEESKDVIYISAPEGRFLDINPAGVELFGYSSEDEILQIDMGRDLYVRPEDREEFRRRMKRQGFVKDYELTFRRKDGKQVIVLATANTVHDENGTVVAYRGIMRDVTEQKLLEQQLLQVQKMESIGTLAGGIAHDFNNILGGILGYASLMKTKMTPDHPFFKYVDTIEKGGKRASELTSQLLGFARGGKYDTKPVDLNAIVEETLGIIGRTFEKSIEIETRPQKPLPTVEADAGQMQQVLLNLCVNAADAMADKGGTLTIATSVEMVDEEHAKRHLNARAGSYLVLSVTDTGTGIDEQTMQRIFEPFFTTKEEGKGTGLGLAMVYGVVKNHGGFVDVSSEPGKGTTFKTYLPSSEKALEEPPTLSEPQLGENELILVVDDEESMRSFVEETLETHGYRTVLAKDGQEAIDAFRTYNGQIALVILDLVMPTMGGRETFLKLKELNRDVKVMLSTGYGQNGKAQEILEGGAKGFLQKPYQVVPLLAKVRAILEA